MSDDRRIYRCEGCGEDRDRDDANEAPCNCCGECAECSPGSTGGTGQTCAACDVADLTGLMLARVETPEHNGRWTVGTIDVTPRGYRWRTVGRSRVEGETDLIRDDVAGSLGVLGRRARARTARLWADALQSIRDGEYEERRLVYEEGR